ncbi:MAG: 2-C-methyl-D-erythritol 2,4-cyclodiphosphate synthase [Verrucomicrobia bacterium]|nr:MAG: 2-C-methyl-D-erythritol 2,4-cyclodiphosphate synthase [Verrucomicrobiota bacterium]
MIHMGIGYDVHRLVEGRKLVLGGVEIPHDRGLEGHSDADVLIHAICDALFGALGESDIGHFFPNNDPRWRDQASSVFLKEAVRLIRLRGGRVINVDSTLIAEAPKIGPHIKKMKTHLSALLEIHPGRLAIKATTNEGLGFVGRGEGIAAMAVASVDLPL